MVFVADIDNLPMMMGYIRQEAQKAQVDDKTIQKIEIASEEAIVNVISYAYPHQKGNLELSCQRTGNRFEILIKDKGLPFNPIDEEIKPQLSQPVHERRIGGYGIFLMRKLIDEVSYERIGEENILCLEFNV